MHPVPAAVGWRLTTRTASTPSCTISPTTVTTLYPKETWKDMVGATIVIGGDDIDGSEMMNAGMGLCMV